MREIKVIDGHVRIADENDEVLYLDTVANFEADFGVALPPMPEGMTSMVYRSGERIMTYYDRKQNAFPMEGSFDWPLAAAVAPAVTDACQAKLARLAAEAAALEAARLPRTIQADRP